VNMSTRDLDAKVALAYTGASARYEVFGQGVSFAQGATLPEAVANLVYAVHERRSQGT